MRGLWTWGRRVAGPRSGRDSVLVIVQNLSLPLDRRVWLECLALRDAGYAVAAICPAGPGDPPRRVHEGVDIYTYRPAPQAAGVVGYAVEFVYSWLRTSWLSAVAWRSRPFAVLQACNPPDTYWALASIWRWRGVRFVFDQHDLNPELFLSRFGEPSGPSGRAQLAALRWLERRTYRTADAVISTNESYRRVALERGSVSPARVTVVRSGPDTRAMRPVHPPEELARPRLLVYLGVMGPQDGVDQALLVMDELVNARGRDDIHLALLGFGDCLDQLRGQASTLGLDAHVTFTGRADTALIADYLSAADIGVCPDLRTPLNDVSTMNKVMEYMAYCLPSVSFDLAESRISAEDSALFVRSGDLSAYADAVERLCDDDDLRVRMGLAARRRVERDLDWRTQVTSYVGVFDRLLGRQPTQSAAARSAVSPPPRRTFVPLADDAVSARFIRNRARPTLAVADQVEEAQSA